VASLGLYVRAFGPRGTFERTYERPPVFIGRRPSSDFLLDTQGVSQTHACVDIRGGAIVVRDCGSANGTLIAGVVGEPHQWTRGGSLRDVVEIHISEWTLQVSALTVAEAPANTGTATLTDLLKPQPLRPNHPSHAFDPRPLPPQERTVAMNPQAGTAVLAPSALPIAGRYAEFLVADRALYDATSRLLAETPGAQQQALCDQLAATYPLMAREPRFVALLKHYGWLQPQGTSLASSALDRMQELVRWYLGPDRSISSEAEMLAFKEHQRRALDELLIGFVRLVSGLDKFEEQMAIHPERPGASSSAEELVRQLLDWRLPADSALQHVRGSFADLMMHQVALLHGIMRGVKALLTELAPETIEAIAKERRGTSLFSFGGPDPWTIYKERHADFSDEENERFRVLFGADFAEEYRLLTRDRKGEGGAAPPVGDQPDGKGTAAIRGRR
jgi:type VI secretion system protein ImpI